MANVCVNSGESDRFQSSRREFGAVPPEADIAEFRLRSIAPVAVVVDRVGEASFTFFHGLEVIGVTKSENNGILATAWSIVLEFGHLGRRC